VIENRASEVLFRPSDGWHVPGDEVTHPGKSLISIA
jgi:hypothetical protein